MPHGLPDWGLEGPKQTTFGLDDLGETAVRLGSPHLYDRRGDVLLLTDFGDGRGAWEDTSGSSSHVIELWTGHSRQGPYSLNLIPGTDDPFDAQLYFEVAPPYSSALGLEFSFSLAGETFSVDAEIRYYNGVNYHHGILRYDNSNNRILYWDATGNFAVLATGVLLDGSEQPIHVLKVVMDMGTATYVRCIVDNVEYPMEVAGVRFPVETTVPPGVVPIMVHFYITVTGTGETPANVFIDNAIVTQNEPL